MLKRHIPPLKAMNNRLFALVDSLEKNRSLSLSEYTELIEGQTPSLFEYAAKKADKVRKSIYGNAVYVRGLIEIGNVCKNDCFYCGIRKSNGHCDRYILKEKDILRCAKQGYELGFAPSCCREGKESLLPM